MRLHRAVSALRDWQRVHRPHVAVQAAECGLSLSLFERLERQGLGAMLLDTQARAPRA